MKSPHLLGECVSNGFVVFVGDVVFRIRSHGIHYDITTIWENVFERICCFVGDGFFFADSIPWYITMTSPPFGEYLLLFPTS